MHKQIAAFEIPEKPKRKIAYIHVSLRSTIEREKAFVESDFVEFECLPLVKLVVPKDALENVGEVVILYGTTGVKKDTVENCADRMRELGIRVQTILRLPPPSKPKVVTYIAPASTVIVPATSIAISKVKRETESEMLVDRVLSLFNRLAIENGLHKEYLKTQVRVDLILDKCRTYGVEMVEDAARGAWIDTDEFWAPRVQGSLEIALSSTVRGDQLERLAWMWRNNGAARRRSESEVRRAWHTQYTALWLEFDGPAHDPAHPFREPYTGPESLVIDKLVLPDGLEIPRFRVTALTHFGLNVVCARMARRRIAKDETENKMLADDVQRIEQRFNEILTTVKRRLADGELENDVTH